MRDKRTQNPHLQTKKPVSKANVFQVDLMEQSLGSTTQTPFETVPNEVCNTSDLLFDQDQPSRIQNNESSIQKQEDPNLMSITKQMVDAYKFQQVSPRLEDVTEDIMDMYTKQKEKFLYVFCKLLLM
jgi:hypothetical protein